MSELRTSKPMALVKRARNVLAALHTLNKLEPPHVQSCLEGASVIIGEQIHEIERLRAALAKYGQHLRGCNGWKDTPLYACDCGWNATRPADETEKRDG
jgi:hypothetical protein